MIKPFILTVFDELYVGYGLIVLACLGAALFASIHWWKYRTVLGVRESLFWLLNGAIFLMLVVPMLLRFTMPAIWLQYLTNIQRFSAHLIFFPFLFGMLCFWAVGAFAIVRLKCSHTLFLVAVFVPLFLFTRAFYLYAVSPQLCSDFATYWELACRSVAEGQILTAENTPDLHLTPVYYRRVFPVWMPLAYLFGSSAWVYKIANVVFQLLSGLMLYRLGTRYFGRRAAQLSLWLVLFVPELLYSCGITSHDLLGVFFLLAFLTAYDAALGAAYSNRVVKSLLLAFAAGLLWFGADLQRSFGVILLLGTFLFALASLWHCLAEKWARTHNERSLGHCALLLLVAFVVPFMAHQGALQLLRANTGLYGTQVSVQRRVLFTSVDNWDGTHRTYLNVKNHMDKVEMNCDPPPTDAFWAGFRRDWFFSEYLRNHIRYTSQMLFRIRSLYSFGQDDTFYFTNLEDSSRAGPEYASLLNVLSVGFMLFFLVVASTGMIQVLMRRDWKIYWYPPLLMLALFMFIVLLIGEVQPRYAYPVWFLLPLYLGKPMTRWFGVPDDGARVFRHLGWGVSVGVFVLSAGFLVAMGAYAATQNKMLYMRHWDVQTSPVAGPCAVSTPYHETDLVSQAQFWHETPGLRFTNNTLRLALVFAAQPESGHYTAAKNRYALQPNGVYTVQGIVQCPFASESAGGDADVFTLQILSNGRTVFEAPFPALAAPRYVQLSDIHLDATGVLQLEFRIRAEEEYTAADWKRVGTAHFSHFQIVKTSP